MTDIPRLARLGSLLLLLGLVGAAGACESGDRTRERPRSLEGPDRGSFAQLPESPEQSASSRFWDHWGDGKAELSGYRGEIRRYDELRDATATFIYVTEPHDRRTWVKDNDVEAPHRVDVLKLNRTLKFQTGIYPYSVMTSVFSPTADWGRPRFQPAKITMTSQEWCGNVFAGIWPGPEELFLEVRSYFSDPGDHATTISVPSETLYQDALPIQLRELDGAFNDGENWRGHVVPTLWHRRRTHRDLEPVEATITRSKATVDDIPVHRFVLAYGDVEVTYDIERAAPHRLIRWSHSNGSHLRLQKTERLSYWKLNRVGDEKYRPQIGLERRIRGGAQSGGAGADAGARGTDAGGGGDR